MKGNTMNKLKTTLLSLLLLGFACTIVNAEVTLSRSSANEVIKSLNASERLKEKITQFNLTNGMEVVVIEDHRAPIVTHMVWYKVGGADEPVGKSGLAHFVEHLMFKGTSNYPAGEFDHVINANGGTQNAFTSYDYTAYFQKIAKEHLPTMMKYESDRMVNVVLTEEVIAPEREVVLEERASRIENNPGAQLGEIVHSALFRNHPYSIPLIGWEDEIKKLSVEDVLAFYKRYYSPNNAILVVAGDVTVEEVRKLAESTYGHIEAGETLPERMRTIVQPPMAEHIITFSNERVNKPSVRKSWVVPSDLTAADNESLALTLLENILGEGTSSRLYNKLIVEEKRATSVSASYWESRRDHTNFSVAATPRDGISLEEILTDIQNEINLIVEEGIDEDELDRIKRNFVADDIYSQDNHTQLARWIGGELTTGFTLDEILNWTDEVLKITTHDIQAVARKYLYNQPAVIGHLVGETKTESN